MTELLSPDRVAPDSGLVVADLLGDLPTLLNMLCDTAAADDPLDAFLLAAGAVQIVEDRLERDTLTLRRAAKHLQRNGARVPAATAMRAMARVAERARALRGSERALAGWRTEMAALRDGLADALVAGRALEGVRDRAERLRADLPDPSRFGPGDVLRLPACFRSFDQRPEDMVRLAEDFAGACPDRDVPVTVFGVRTSGSYLGPLVAAALARAGYRHVEVCTARPHSPLWRGDRKRLRSSAKRGGVAIVVDDPPVSGGSVRRIVSLLLRAGFPPQSVTMLLALFHDVPPSAPAGVRVLTLPFERWAVHERFTPDAVGRTLSALLGTEVSSVQRTRLLQDGRGRSHVRARYRAHCPERGSFDVVVSGAGLGYLGRHGVAVDHAVAEHAAVTFGFHDGLLFREWFPESARLHTPGPGDVPAFVSYVRQRAASLPARRDVSAGLSGRAPAWEMAGRLLAAGFGRAGVALRSAVIDPAVRRLCTVEAPSIVDGATSVANWFRIDGTLRKIDTDTRDFSNRDLYCYDPVFDLAGIDPGGVDSEFTAALRAEYDCPDERFLLYQMAHLSEEIPTDPRAARAAARAAQRYAAARYGGDQPPVPDGPLCALDIDGVLESGTMGFPIITPTALTALHALTRHGFRPVVVTGRSLDEVRSRCAAYSLAGGVAEYGSVAYDHLSGRTIELVSEAGRRALDRLRAALAEQPDIVVDDAYRHALRCYRRLDDRLTAVPPSAIAAALDALGADQQHVRVIPGRGQTDVIAADVDKGRGVTGLAELLAEPGEPAPEVELAVGDTAADLPMLALARRAFGPGNAETTLREQGIRILRARYAAGLASAVGHLLGHSPGECPACRPPELGPDARLLAALLTAQERGPRGVLRAAWRGTIELCRTRR